MQNTILYTACSSDEVHECSYSLLKYLDIYNLKPPASHAVVVYTHDPASLEGYSVFFEHFELKDLREEECRKSQLELLKSLDSNYKGNLLYMGNHVYPVQELDPLFSAMGKGNIVLNKTDEPSSVKLHMLGFNNLQGITVEKALESGSTLNGQDYFHTYDELKEFRVLLRRFFKKYQEESIPNQVKLMHSIDAGTIGAQKKNFQRLPLLARVLRRISGSAWNIKAYTKKL